MLQDAKEVGDILDICGRLANRILGDPYCGQVIAGLGDLCLGCTISSDGNACEMRVAYYVSYM